MRAGVFGICMKLVRERYRGEGSYYSSRASVSDDGDLLLLNATSQRIELFRRPVQFRIRYTAVSEDLRAYIPIAMKLFARLLGQRIDWKAMRLVSYREGSAKEKPLIPVSTMPFCAMLLITMTIESGLLAAVKFPSGSFCSSGLYEL